MKHCLRCKNTFPGNHVCPYDSQDYQLSYFKNQKLMPSADLKPKGTKIAKVSNQSNPFLKVPIVTENRNIPRQLSPSYQNETQIGKVPYQANLTSQEKALEKSGNNLQNQPINKNIYVSLEELRLLGAAVNFLIKVKAFTQKIFDHYCANMCVLCILQSLIQNYNIPELQNLYKSIQNIMQRNFKFLSFVDTVEILLTCMHYIYHEKTSQDSCFFNCISHDLFALHVFENITCQCQNSREIFWNKNKFVYSVYYENIGQSLQNMIFSNEKILPIGCSDDMCRMQNSVKKIEFLGNRLHVLIEIFYGDTVVSVNIQNISDLVIQGFLYVLTGFAVMNKDEICNFTEEEMFWNCKELRVHRMHLSELSQYLNRLNLFPILLIFSKTFN